MGKKIKKVRKNVLVVANVSAGKSTLINSLVGVNICKSTNFACTSKLAKITCHFGDQRYYECVKGGRTYRFGNNYQNLANVGFDDITLLGKGLIFKENVTFIDTPGTNNAMDSEHEKITLEAIKSNEYELLVYVSNVTTQMTDDEAFLLNFVSENCKKKVLIVVNKMDDLSKDESVSDYLISYSEELLRRGISVEAIVPVSALGYTILSDKGYDEYEHFLRKFSNSKFELQKMSICNNSDLELCSPNRNDVKSNTGIPFLRSIICEILKRDTSESNGLVSSEKKLSELVDVKYNNKSIGDVITSLKSPVKNVILGAENLYKLGSDLYFGENGQEKDINKAYKYLSKSSKLGNVYATALLGRMYYFGHVVEKDFNKAIEFLTPAANEGFWLARNCLGMVYYDKQDYCSAYHWFKISADSNNIWGLFQMGCFYYYGLYVDEDKEQAFSYFLRSADLNFSLSYWYVAIIYYDRGCYAYAYVWFKKSAESGDTSGMCGLGKLYLVGQGIKKDLDQAYQWLSRAADDSEDPDVDACFLVGNMYEFGNGVSENHATAMSYYRRAANLGDERAQNAVSYNGWANIPNFQKSSNDYSRVSVVKDSIPNDNDNIKSEIRKFIADYYGRPYNYVMSFMTLREIGCDNVSKLSWDLQHWFNVSIPEAYDKKFNTVGDVCFWVAPLIKSKRKGI